MQWTQTSADVLAANPHCAQSTQEHRHSFSDLQFSQEVRMGEKEQPCREYVDLKGEESSVVHWGQMKLLLGEIEFLTPYIHIPDITIVYVGSSPGHHLPALVNLMPSTWTWDLYDSRPCEVYHSDDQPLLEKVAMPSKRSVLVGEEVKVANEAADQRMAELQAQAALQAERVNSLRSRPEIPRQTLQTATDKLFALQNTVVVVRKQQANVRVHRENLSVQAACNLHTQVVRRPQTEADPQMLVISDLRTPMLRITEHTVFRDMSVQLELLRALRPYQASLKFKLPYSTELFHPNTQYLPGSIRYQPLSPRISHETRLVTERGSNFTTLIPYSSDEYARRMFHYQTVLRTSVYNTEDPVADAARHPFLCGNGVATDHCFDCACCRNIAQEYILKAAAATEDVKMAALDLLNELTRQVASTQLSCKSEAGAMLEE